jgi:hypothetical protein
MNQMTRSQPTERAVPTFRSIQEAADFWDTHSTTEFEDHWQPIDTDVARPLQRAWLVTVELDEATFVQLRAAAERLGIGTDELALKWLRERLVGPSDSSAAD